MTLQKIVAIEEEGHSIDIQVQIVLEWKDNRVTFHSLKAHMYLNTLSLDDLKQLWLPLVVVANTQSHSIQCLNIAKK